MFDLSGKNALITGASGGIGGSIAKIFYRAGANVALTGTRSGPLEELASQLGDNAHVLLCNLSDMAAVDILPKQAMEVLGGVDILVNNAGITRDNIFMRMSDEEWQSVFENDEEQVEFWSTVRSSGRVKRDNIELLLYCMLIIETKKEVRLEKLFSEYKLHIKDMALEEKKQFLLKLNDLANLYLEMPQKEQLVEISYNDEIKRFFHLLDSLEITTIFPLVLYLYSNITDDQELTRCFKILESFVALRQVCKFTTKNYNNLFIQIIRSLDKIKSERKIEASDLIDILKSFNEFGNRFPTKVEVEEAFHTSVLSNKQAGAILYIIALKDIDSEYSDTKTLSSNSFSVEHMMPKKWEENWSESNFDELSKFKRNQKILTIGNLTLITKNLNSKLRNQSWANKKLPLKEYSSLKMTRSFLELEKWDEESISERANQLCDKALEIWNVE